METNRRVKFDGKHWIGKKYYNKPIKIYSSDHVAKQARKMLGSEGMVAIPEARPDDLRSEEVVEELYGAKRIVGSGGIVYDHDSGIYFLKAQEVNTKIDDIDIVLLAYNLPWGIEGNLNDKDGYAVLDEAEEKGTIIGITGPSCIKGLEKLSKGSLDKILKKIDFFVGYSGSKAIRGTNDPSLAFYDRNIHDKYEIGLTAVSGGHRTPRIFFEQSIGTSYTEINEPRGDHFIEDFRNGLRSSRRQNLTMEPVPIMDTIRHGVSKIMDKFRKH